MLKPAVGYNNLALLYMAIDFVFVRTILQPGNHTCEQITTSIRKSSDFRVVQQKLGNKLDPPDHKNDRAVGRKIGYNPTKSG